MVDLRDEQPALCLEFANTVQWHASDHPLETLHSYLDLIVWAQGASRLSSREAEQLARVAQEQPGLAAEVFQRGIAVREAIYRVFVARLNNREAHADDLTCISNALSSALAHTQIRVADRGFVWLWDDHAMPLERVLWPIVRSAADILTSADLLARVGQCADDRGCGWLFLDLSKNHSRRWCDINDCGNRAKQRRHYQRAQQRI